MMLDYLPNTVLTPSKCLNFTFLMLSYAQVLMKEPQINLEATKHGHRYFVGIQVHFQYSLLFKKYMYALAHNHGLNDLISYECLEIFGY